MRRRIWIAVGAVALLVVGIGVVLVAQDDYELKVLMRNADHAIYPGGQVRLNGQQVGEITDVGVQGDQALVTAAVDGDHAPLPAGTTARISWLSVVGTRVLELVPGKQGNPDLPSGKMVTSKVERVEIDDLLATLDGPTRKRVQGLVKRLDTTLRGRDKDVQSTLKTAGPSIRALGDVMRAVGEDGPAIRSLVNRLRKMTGELANRDDELAQTVQSLGTLTSRAGKKQESLKEALGELPSTMQEAQRTLGDVPKTVDATVPLLADLRPATRQLQRVSGNLSPVLKELRPTVADLGPTLRSGRALLGETPGLLDSAHATLPDVNDAVTGLQPAVEHFRPYTPELAGWLSNWTSIFASQSNGNYVRTLIPASATSFTDNPGLLPPGMSRDPKPAPGSIVDQPWTDANGDGVR